MLALSARPSEIPDNDQRQNFGSKAALFAAVLDRAVTEVCDALNQAAESGTTVSDLLTAFLAPDHMERFHAPGSFGFLFADASSLTTEPGVEEAVRHALRRLAAALADLLRRGQCDRDIRADTSIPKQAPGG